MAIQLLKPFAFLAAAAALVGCEKWVDGVVSEVEFPPHTPTLAATVNLISGESKAVAALFQTSSTLTAGGSTIPAGVTARIKKGDEVVLSWSTGDTALVGEGWAGRTMHVLDLDTPLSLPLGQLELEVEAPGFEILTAVAVQPPTPELTVDYVQGVDTTTEFGEAVILDRFKLNLLNRAGVRDVYGLQLQEGYVYSGDTVWNQVGLGEFDAVLEPRTVYNDACLCLLVDDQGVDAHSFQNITLDRKRWEWSSEEGEEVPLRLKVTLMDAPMADFYGSLENHWNAENNPFANPSSIYSNTSTGFGIFGLASEVSFNW